MRVFAYEEHSYTHRFRDHTIAKGETVDISRQKAEQLVASNPGKLVIVADGDPLPNSGEYATTMKVFPDTDRRMVPGRLSEGKRRLLLKAKKEGRRNAHLTVTR